jgi:DNA polymerase-3 subunit epsilon
MENVLIIDTETTGLDPSKGAIMIEIGAMLYNLKHKQVLQNFSTFLPCDSNPVENINNIKAEVTREKMPVEAGLIFLKYMADKADAMVAHNAEFDRKFLQTNEILSGSFAGKKWICTKKDFRWPVQLYRNRLQDICSAMGVPYADAHRALIDCHFLALCFTKVDDLEQRMISASRAGFGSGKGFV